MADKKAKSTDKGREPQKAEVALDPADQPSMHWFAYASAPCSVMALTMFLASDPLSSEIYSVIAVLTGIVGAFIQRSRGQSHCLASVLCSGGNCAGILFFLQRVELADAIATGRDRSAEPVAVVRPSRAPRRTGRNCRAARKLQARFFDQRTFIGFTGSPPLRVKRALSVAGSFVRLMTWTCPSMKSAKKILPGSSAKPLSGF